MTNPLQNRLLPERLSRHGAALTGSERGLAQALTDGWPHALLDSATALASRTGTSASTVVRLFAKLGYESYAQAQKEAREEVASLLQTAGQRAPAALGTRRSLGQCVEDAAAHDQRNLAATRDGLDGVAFETIATRLAKPEGRVFVFAQLNSAPVAGWLTLHLNMCRPRVQQLGAGAASATDELLWIAPDDVLLAFSIRRYAAGPARVAQRFREAGAQVFGIVDGPAAPLAARADAWVQVHTANASPFRSYTAAFFLCNALVSAVAQLRGQAVSDALQRRDALWSHFEDQLELPVGRTGGRAKRRTD